MRRGPRLPARLGFPVPTEGGQPFDDDERFFEPWWPGALALLRREGDRVELRTEHLSDPLAVFPELRSMASLLAADGVIVEGILMALDAEGRPDPRLLRRHLAGAVSGAAVDAAFVATDLAYLEGRSVARLPVRGETPPAGGAAAGRPRLRAQSRTRRGGRDARPGGRLPGPGGRLGPSPGWPLASRTGG